MATYLKCYCDGLIYPKGRMHYPSGDPENGPAHRPAVSDPSVPSVTRAPMRHATWPEAHERDQRRFCPDCGEYNQQRGHQTCPYPSDEGGEA